MGPETYFFSQLKAGLGDMAVHKKMCVQHLRPKPVCSARHAKQVEVANGAVYGKADHACKPGGRPGEPAHDPLPMCLCQASLLSFASLALPARQVVPSLPSCPTGGLLWPCSWLPRASPRGCAVHLHDRGRLGRQGIPAGCCKRPGKGARQREGLGCRDPTKISMHHLSSQGQSKAE